MNTSRRGESKFPSAVLLGRESENEKVPSEIDELVRISKDIVKLADKRHGGDTRRAFNSISLILHEETFKKLMEQL